jgi:hypothetical protein
MSFEANLRQTRLVYLERRYNLIKELELIDKELASMESMGQGYEQGMRDAPQANTPLKTPEAVTSPASQE